MELSNEFRVPLPVDRAWAVLTDVERIAPCLPGAQLQEIEGDEYRGVVKVKVGPITAQYKGKATFLSQDEAAHIAVLRAEGRETRGQGNANATITATLTPDEGGTAVSVLTDLTITGRVAQFGRGVLADVSAKLLDQFVANLEQTVLVDEPGGTADRTAGSVPMPGAEDAPPVEAVDVELHDPIEAVQPDADEAAAAGAPPAARQIHSPEPEAVDLLGTAGAPVAKRVGPVLALVAMAWLLRKLLSRRRR